ncbi:MAG: hypothetical protein ACLR5N_08480 [Haemophilus parainfluenzae]
MIKGKRYEKLISIAALAVLTACTAPQEASSIGNGAAAYNMNTVQDYNFLGIKACNTVSVLRENQGGSKREYPK